MKPVNTADQIPETETVPARPSGRRSPGNGKWTAVAIYFLCGVLVGGGTIFLAMNRINARSRRANAEIAGGMLASLRLATIRTLRDENAKDDTEAVDNVLAELEGGLQGDLELLEKLKKPSGMTEALVRQIKEYQKKHPLPAQPAASQQQDD